MTTPAERIQDLVRKGALPPADGATLLAALARQQQAHGLRLLLDPLARFGGLRLALAGLGASLAGLALTSRGLRFDGLLDIHIADHAWPLHVAVSDALVAWPLGAVVLWLASLAGARQGRLIDFLGVVGVSRLPAVACGLALVGLASAGVLPRISHDQAPAPMLGILVHVILGLLGVGWNLVLQYVGFGTASGMRGGKRIAVFIVAVLSAELLSKMVLFRLSNAA
jgi:hypothetical protein